MPAKPREAANLDGAANPTIESRKKSGNTQNKVARFGPVQTNIAGIALKFRLSTAKWQHNLMTDLCIVCNAVSSEWNALNLLTFRVQQLQPQTTGIKMWASSLLFILGLPCLYI